MTTNDWDDIRKLTRPLKATRRIPSAPPVKPMPPRKSGDFSAPPPPPMPRHAAALAPSQRGNIDGSTQTRLRKGKLPIEGTLDLHGYRLENALAALEHFVQQAYSARKRCVLVITGKGRTDRPSIRGLLPEWINLPSIRPYLLALEPAVQKEGGSGAFYLLLKAPNKR